jgi:hypothetical protein
MMWPLSIIDNRSTVVHAIMLVVPTAHIAPLPTNWSSVEQADIDRAVHIRYQEVDRLLHELRELYTVQNAAQPVNQLPSDILAAIMQQYRVDSRVYDDVGRRKAEEFPHQWFKLGAVCRHWRAVFLGHPLLWTDITLTSPTCLDLILSRSAEAPCHVISALGDWETRAECYALLLCRARHRIRHLDVVLPPELGAISSGSAAARLRDPATWCLPALESVYINAFYGYEVALVQLLCNGLTRSPFLQRIDIQSASWTGASACVRPGLRSLRMCNTYPRLNWIQWIDALRTTPDLDILELANAVCDVETHSNPAPTEQIPLLRLKRLRLLANTSKAGESNANLLDHLVLPSLSSVSLLVSADVDCRHLFAAIAAKCGCMHLAFARVAYDVDWITVDFWMDEHPVSQFLDLPTLSSSDSLYPFPPCFHLSVKSKPSSHSKPILRDLMCALSLSSVSSLLVHGATRVKTEKDSWISLACMHNIQKLCIVGTDPVRSFLGVFNDSPMALDPDATPTALFPKLEALQVVRVEWAVAPQLPAQNNIGDDVEAAEPLKNLHELLAEALGGRKTQGLPSLKRLQVEEANTTYPRCVGKDLRDLIADISFGLE